MIIQKDKEIINDPDYKRNKFAVSKKNSIKIETKNKICINVFCFENKLTCLIYVPDQKFENSMDLLRISNENKSHCEYIKDFDRFWFNKTRNKNKKYFCKRCLHCFSNKNVQSGHNKFFKKINGGQTVKLKVGFIEFRNYFKQIQVPFKTYANFECI